MIHSEPVYNMSRRFVGGRYDTIVYIYISILDIYMYNILCMYGVEDEGKLNWIEEW